MLHRILYSILFVILFSNHFSADAQHKRSVHYKIEDGLLSNTIYTILQDQKGFIWISTDNGVCRFDGQKFKRYSTANGLPDNDILSMEIDVNDRIWLSTFNKNLCYIQNGKVHSRHNDTNLAGFKQSSYIKFLARLSSGIVIVDDGNGSVYELTASAKIKKNGSLRSIVNIGNYYLYFNKGQLECYTHQHRFTGSCKVSSRVTDVVSIHQAGLDSFVVITPTAVFSGSVQGGIPYVQQQAQATVPKGRFFSSNKQLWIIDRDNILQRYTFNGNENDQRFPELSQLNLTYFFIDRNGGYWIGTKGDGIYYYPNIDMVYYNTSDGLLNENAFLSCVNGEQLYVLLSGGKIQKFLGQQVDKHYLDVSASCAGRVNRFFVNDNFIVAGSDIGCLYYCAKNNQQQHCSQHFASIKDIEYDHGKKILLATSSQVAAYDLMTAQTKVILKERHTCVKRIDDNTLLAGGVNFLRIIHYPVADKADDSVYVVKDVALTNATIADIQTDHSLVAVATVEKGVYLYMNNRLYHLSVKSGLTDNNCKSIFFDHARHMWVSTAMGLNKVMFDENRQRYTIEQYTTYCGLATNNVNCVNEIGGYMYASGSKGIMRFPENYLQINKDKPGVFITEVNINGKVLQDNPGKLLVHPDSNSIRIDFSGIEFKSFGHIRFFYRIKGLIDNWKEVTEGINLDRLNPGTYQLEIQALSAYNRWSDKPAQLQISILPYWWQQTYFKWLMAGAAIFLISFVTRYFLNRQYKQKFEQDKIKQQLIELELKALKAQINPHFIFNTLNAIQYFIQNEENDRADNYLNKTSKLIRSTLNFSNETSISLSDELDYIDNYLALESLRFDEDFSYHIQRNIPDSLGSTPIPTMVLQPHIENGVRHGLKPKKNGDKKLDITVDMDTHYIICVIEDNGIGRKRSEEINRKQTTVHISQGLQLAGAKLEMFKKMFNKDVQLLIEDLYENHQPSGTRVTIKIQR